MKKIISLICALFLSATVFASTPAKELLTGVYDFVTKPSANWTIYDGYFSKIDVTEEEYVFTGGFIVKILVGYSRYDFTCTIKNGESDFTVELSDFVTYACSKNGDRIKNGTIFNSSANVAAQYAEQMKTEIKERISSFEQAGTLDSNYDAIVTHPEFLNVASKSMSDLAMKKFAEKNINGKTVNFPVKLTSIDENDSYIYSVKEKAAYKATGSVEVFKEKIPGLILTVPYPIIIYSNNEKLASAKVGSTYTINGKVHLTFSSLSPKTGFYTVEEE